MSRPARALIDLEALRANYSQARAVHGGRVAAVLKANAYGHGAERCAKALASVADAFALAFVDEALTLREAGISAPMLVLEGAFAGTEVELAVRHDLWLVVHHEEQLRMLERRPPGSARIQAWLKVDSGMHRAGFAPAEVQAAWARLSACDGVSAVRLMTHLASADETGSDQTDNQLRVFRTATARIPGERSAANSAGLLGWRSARLDWARAGLMLYGVDPLGRAASGLAPVMTLESRVFAERWIKAGESVGYGACFTAERHTRVGLVAMGYADGYPRIARTGTPVAVGGRITRVIGRVSMDMLTVDLTDLPEIELGARVELWGTQVPVAAVAAAAGTIPYEILCNIKRVPVRTR